MKIDLKSILTKNNRIVAIKTSDELEKALFSSSKIIFILNSNICNIEEMTRKVKAQGKLCFVHLDMIQGLNAKDNYALTFLKENSFADGIITTKPQIAKIANRLGFLVILRCFIIDSMSFMTAFKLFNEPFIDAIEILPGVMPKIIKKITDKSPICVIAGGLISDLEDIEIALKNGAVAISTTKLSLIK